MARPRKDSIDYFPHNTHHSNIIFILESKWGNNGYATWYKLMEVLGAANGMFIDCRNTANWLHLKAYTLLTEDVLAEIIGTLVELGCIDKELWEHKIIYCQDLVDEVVDAFKKRVNSLPNRGKVFVSTMVTSAEFPAVETSLNCKTSKISLLSTSGNAESETEMESYSETDTKSAAVARRVNIEDIFHSVFNEKEAKIRELYPEANYEIEKETCIAYYCEDVEAAKKPYSYILKWFNRIKTKGDNNGRGREGTGTPGKGTVQNKDSHDLAGKTAGYYAGSFPDQSGDW